MSGIRQTQNRNLPVLVTPGLSDRLWRPRWAGICLVGFLLFGLIGLNPLADNNSMAGSSDGNMGQQVVIIGLTGLLLLTTWRPGNLRANLALSWPILGLLAYCLFTLAWSAVPMIGLRRLALTTIGLWVLYRATNELGYGRTLLLMRIVAIILLVANYLAVMFTAHGIHHYELGSISTEAGSWRGIMIHKNLTGSATAISAILFIFDRRGLSRAFCNVVLVALLVFLVFTQSKTSISSMGAALAAGYAIRFLKVSNRSQTAISAIVLLLAALPLAAIYFGDLLETLNDPNAFTGRGQIWALLFRYAGDHFWTGAGFGSFWQVGAASPVLSLASGWVAELAAAGHNGYLDLLVTIGFPGLMLAVLVLLVMPAQRLMLADSAPRASRSLLFSIVVFCIFNNLTESELISGVIVDQMFLTITLALIPMIAPARKPVTSKGFAHRALRRLSR